MIKNIKISTLRLANKILLLFIGSTIILPALFPASKNASAKIMFFALSINTASYLLLSLKTNHIEQMYGRPPISKKDNPVKFTLYIATFIILIFFCLGMSFFATWSN